MHSLLRRAIIVLFGFEIPCELVGKGPGPLNVRILGEYQMNDVIIFEVNLPPVPPLTDVVARELVVVINDQVQDVKMVSPEDTTIVGLMAPQDSTVVLELRDIDDAGNKSEPSVHMFTAIDSVAPPQPGELGVTIVGEEIGPGSSVD